MRATSFRPTIGRRVAWLSIAMATIVLRVCLLSFDTVVALSTPTRPVTAKKLPLDVASAETFVANGESSQAQAESNAQPCSMAMTPDERSELLNKHLRREISAQTMIERIQGDIGASIAEAALRSAQTQGYDPRFGRPALKSYRSFVYSDQHAADPLLLDGLAIKTAKQIRNMIKQTSHLANGIVSPPKDEDTARADNPPRHFREKIANSIAKGERRARERNQRKLREVCKGCSRPFNLCLCDVLNEWKISNETGSNEANAGKAMMRRTKVIVLQHPNEFRKKHTSTVPLLKMVLREENIKIKVGYEFTKEDIGLSDGDDVRSRPIMLFPGPEALDLDKYVENRQQQQSRQPQQSIDAVDDETKSDGNNILPPSESDEKAREKYTLVLIDGTWSEAKRIIRKSPEILEGCQMVQFAFADALDEKGEISNPVDDIASPQSSWPTTPESDSDKATKSRSIYHAMRREPEEHCLSTLEACGEALRILEGATHGPRLQTALKAVLSKHVELHLKNAREASKSRHNRDTTSRNSKIRRSKEIEQAIYGGTNVGGNTTTTTYNSHPSDSIVSPYGGGAVPPTTIAGTPTRRLALDSHTSVTIRRLTHEDIPVIDAWWENGGTPKSTMTITRSIDADYRLGIGASLGIVDESTGALVACILRYESGPLGILHVSEEHRRKGYGTALLREATEAVSRARSELDLPLECSAFIKDGNAASEKVFERVGYVRENPNAKRGTGKRRANRKWIVPSLPTEERR